MFLVSVVRSPFNEEFVNRSAHFYALCMSRSKDIFRENLYQRVLLFISIPERRKKENEREGELNVKVDSLYRCSS